MKYSSIFSRNPGLKKALSIVLVLSYVVMPLTPAFPVGTAYAATTVQIPNPVTLSTTPSAPFNDGEIGGPGIDLSGDVVKGSGSIGFHNDQATKDHLCQIKGYTANTDGIAVTGNVNDCGQATIVSWDGSKWVGTACSSIGSEYVSQVSCGPVTEIVDVCTNIDGVQTSVPSGYTTDGSGNCSPVVVVNMPTISFTATPTTVNYGSASTLTWSTTNASSCTASGVWSGSKTTSGSEQTAGLTADSSYTLTCANSVGSTTAVTVTVLVNGTGNHAPTAPIVTGPTAGIVGTSYTFSFNSTDPEGDDIAYGVDWNNDGIFEGDTPEVLSGATSSLSNTWNTTGTKTFTVVTRDIHLAQSAPTVYTIDISSVPVVTPTGTLTATPASVAANGSTTLAWNIASADTCTASNGWSGTKSTNSSEVVSNIATSTTFTLTCTNSTGGSAVFTADVSTYTVNPNPVIDTFTANPTNINLGGYSNLAWSTTNAASCTASATPANSFWNGSKPASGLDRIEPINATTTFTLTCVGATGLSTSSDVTVNVGNGGGNNNPTTTPAVIIDAPNDPTTTELGSSVVYNISLSKAPLADVTMSVNSSDYTEGTTSVRTLTFTPSNWNVNQPVVVTGIDDLIVDGNVVYSVAFSTTSSVDITFNNLPAQTFNLINLDNESPATSSVSFLSFVASPASVSNGGISVLSWTATGTISSCTASGGWSGNKSSVGSETVGPLSTTTPFTLMCTGAGGTATSTLTINVDNSGGNNNPGGNGGGNGGGPGDGSGTHRHCVGYECPDIMVYIDSIAPKVCKNVDYITTFMKKGVDNNPGEVTKLQYFFNEYEGSNLTINGIFDDATEGAVKAFQTKYATDILEPWGTTTPTGIVYVTTTAKINAIFCGANPDYNGTIEIKDKTIQSVLDKATTTPEFTGDIGMATSTGFGLDNIAGILGSITDKLIGFLKNIPWYLFIVSLMSIIGSVTAAWKEIKNKIKKEGSATIKDISKKTENGLKLIALATLLNVLNTVSFMSGWSGFNHFAGIDVNTVAIAQLVNLVATLVGFGALSINILRKN